MAKKSTKASAKKKPPVVEAAVVSGVDEAQLAQRASELLREMGQSGPGLPGGGGGGAGASRVLGRSGDGPRARALRSQLQQDAGQWAQRKLEPQGATRLLVRAALGYDPFQHSATTAVAQPARYSV